MMGRKSDGEGLGLNTGNVVVEGVIQKDRSGAARSNAISNEEA